MTLMLSHRCVLNWQTINVNGKITILVKTVDFIKKKKKTLAKTTGIDANKRSWHWHHWDPPLPPSSQPPVPSPPPPQAFFDFPASSYSRGLYKEPLLT